MLTRVPAVRFVAWMRPVLRMHVVGATAVNAQGVAFMLDCTLQGADTIVHPTAAQPIAENHPRKLSLAKNTQATDVTAQAETT